MNVENKFREISEYFNQKIINGEYKFIKCNERTATVLIDEKYEIEIWITNDPKDYFEIYNEPWTQNIFHFTKFRTQKERLAGWRKIKPKIEAYRKEILLIEKQKEINRLKSELEELNKTII
jgi:hypothetical protein